MNPYIVFNSTNGVGTITLDRPISLNALSAEMIDSLRRILSSCISNPEIDAVLIYSSTSKAFCAGGDLRFFYKARTLEASDGFSSLERFFNEEYTLNHLIHHYPKPYVTILDGIVMGGGMGIAQSSSHLSMRIATERTTMAMPEVNIGLFPDVGGGYFLSRLPGKIGLWMALTGESINTEDALYAGLADVFVPSAELPALFALLQTGHEDYLALVREFAKPFVMQTNIAHSRLAQQRDLIDQHFSADNIPDILASLAKDDHPFTRQTAETIMRRSPLMLCITLEQLRRSRTMTLADCLRMERSIMQHCLAHGEMVEGIRAAIIDKDNLPRWQPATLEEVTPDMIARFFVPAWPEQVHPLRMLKG